MLNSTTLGQRCPVRTMTPSGHRRSWAGKLGRALSSETCLQRTAPLGSRQRRPTAPDNRRALERGSLTAVRAAVANLPAAARRRAGDLSAAAPPGPRPLRARRAQVVGPAAARAARRQASPRQAGRRLPGRLGRPGPPGRRHRGARRTRPKTSVGGLPPYPRGGPVLTSVGRDSPSVTPATAGDCSPLPVATAAGSRSWTMSQ
jgi:hypothetical protein